MNKKAIIGAVLVITAMMVYAGMATPVNNAAAKSEYIKVQTVHAINQPLVTTGLDGNVLVSSNNPDGDDTHPKVISGGGKMFVTYEQHISTFEVTTPIAVSEDNGNTWTLAYDIGPSLEGSGLLTSPDIAYCPTTGEVFYDSVDPIADIYNLKISKFPADLSATEIPIYQVSGSGATDHYTAAVTWVSDIIVTPYVCDEPDYDLWQCPGLGYWQGENFDHPPNIGGFYYDGQSILHTAPANYMEAATGSERMYMVMQTDNESTGTSMISFKATVTDLDLLLTSGGGPGGMDKYADVEVWPWQRHFKAADGALDAREPDVSASGTNVVVVYMSNDNIFGDWDIVCAYSSDSGDTWAYSTISTPQVDDTNPAVFVSGNMVYCIYVSAGNLYMVISEDGGATWGAPEKINDQDGTVVAEEGATDISDGGIVWVDNRDGVKNIYYAPLPMAILSVDITGGFGVKATVTNTGTAAGENIPWSVDLSGLVFLGGHSEGTIASLAPGASETVGPGLVLGIGPTTITATAGGATKTASGFVLGPMVLGL